MTIYVLSDNLGYFLSNEENLAKEYCDVYGGEYWEYELSVPVPEDSEEIGEE